MVGPEPLRALDENECEPTVPLHLLSSSQCSSVSISNVLMN